MTHTWDDWQERHRRAVKGWERCAFCGVLYPPAEVRAHEFSERREASADESLRPKRSEPVPTNQGRFDL